MSDSKSTRRVYSADELHSLRNACSVAKLREAIEERDGEDAELVKEHVLRGSRSFAARSFRSRPGFEGSRVPSDRTNDENAVVAPATYQPSAQYTGNAILGEIASNNQIVRGLPTRLRPSPTPSLKRKKAEAIVRAHGSPTHVRVTAGGRIVPRDQSPLCFPRFGYSAIKANGGLIKFAPNHPIGKAAQWTQTAHDGSQNGFVAQDIEGRLCQIVNGTILPLAEIDGALHLYMPAPNLNITQRNTSLRQPLNPPANVDFMPHLNVDARASSRPAAPLPVVPSTAAQISALELEYSKLEHELKELDKTEVIHGKTMGKPAKDALVAKRRELVISMDKIRKARKTLKDQSQPVAAHSPGSHAHSAHSSMSPPVSRLLPSMQHGMPGDPRGTQPKNDNSFPNALYGVAPFMPMASPFTLAPFPVPDNAYVGTPYMLPSPGMLMQPPLFDGTQNWAAPYQGYSDVGGTGTYVDTDHSKDGAQKSHMPQHDGAASKTDLRSPSPRQSHAVPLKDPATKQVINLKSLLNPKSPIYKPNHSHREDVSFEANELKSARDRSPTPLSFRGLATLQSSQNAVERQLESEHRISCPMTAKSSVSSFRTSDFFPNNAREHSMRQHEYPTPSHTSEEKENGLPRRSDESEPVQSHDDNWNPAIPSRAFDKLSSPASHAQGPPTAPPGTPVDVVVPSRAERAAANLGHVQNSEVLLNRRIHNTSPKATRTLQLMESPAFHDGNFSVKAHSSNAEDSSSKPSSVIDFSNMSRDWIQGYQAGLHRRPVGADCDSSFLDGYCSGLLKSQPVLAPTLASGKNDLVLHSSDSSSLQQSDHDSVPKYPHDNAVDRPPLELSHYSTDCLKQAVIATSNESAVLSPELDGPRAEEITQNLGAWQKHHQAAMSAGGDGLLGFPFPERGSSITNTKRPELLYGSNASPGGLSPPRRPTKDPGFEPLMQSRAHPHVKRSSDDGSPTPLTISKHEHKLASEGHGGATRLAHAMPYRPFSESFAHRSANPLEWRHSSSIAHVANLSSKFFANAQFDGLPADRLSQYNDSTPMLSNAAGIAGASANLPQTSRFKEASLDGLSPPLSPPPDSPQVSPKASPRNISGMLQRDKSSPQKIERGKMASPTKVRLEQLAGKVGLRSSPDREPLCDETSSSPTKHRWRDIWKGARRDPAQTEMS